MSKSNLIK